MASSRRIVITGVSRGLGRALADALVADGHAVAGCARSAEPSRNGPMRVDRVDVADAAAVRAWADELLDGFGVPDLVINNAALINEPVPLWEIDPGDFDALMRVNVTGTHHVVAAFLPAMIVAGTGVVVNLSSGWGRSVSANVAPYCASKWAIEGLTRALAQELPAGLAAVPLNPGIIDTDMLRTTWGEGAGGFEDAEAWARRAAPYVLGLGPADNGRPATVPG